ncbi:MAG TPA: sodium:calcium antiporter, partial [Gammaproteobacteria bacterium]|nr:sodium:calcium antiporter [Gammaproteobacteria bacterium]
MFFLIMQLLIMLFIILLASQGLTNALEYFGHRLGLSAGVIGSIFAAIATALPETTVPFIALFAGTSNQKVNEEIGVGAILGAPLMISTLSTCLMALFVIKRRGLRGWIQPEKVGFVRDLNYFILAFLLSALAMYVPLQPFLWRILISIVLVLLYCIYLYSTFKASKQLVAQGYGVVPDEPLIFSKL